MLMVPTCQVRRKQAKDWYIDVIVFIGISEKVIFLALIIEYNAVGRQHRGCIIPQAVTHILVLLRWKNNCPKHVELTGIVNKSLLLHLVGCLYYLYFLIFF